MDSGIQVLRITKGRAHERHRDENTFRIMSEHQQGFLISRPSDNPKMATELLRLKTAVLRGAASNEGLE